MSASVTVESSGVDQLVVRGDDAEHLVVADALRDILVQAAHHAVEQPRGLAVGEIGDTPGCGDQDVLDLGRFPVKRGIKPVFGGGFRSRRLDFQGGSQR